MSKTQHVKIDHDAEGTNVTALIIILGIVVVMLASVAYALLK